MILTSNVQSMKRVRYKCRQKDVAVFSKLQNTFAEGLWFGFVGKRCLAVINDCISGWKVNERMCPEYWMWKDYFCTYEIPDRQFKKLITLSI